MRDCQEYQETKGIVRDSKCISNVEDINDINNENHQEFEIIFIAKVKLTKWIITEDLLCETIDFILDKECRSKEHKLSSWNVNSY